MNFYGGNRLYFDGYREGYIMAALEFFIEEYSKKKCSEDRVKGIMKLKEALEPLYGDIPVELCEEVIELNKIKDKELFRKNEGSIYVRYIDYFETTPIYKIATKSAEENTAKRINIREYAEILDYIYENANDRAKESTEVMLVKDIQGNGAFQFYGYDEYTTDERIMKAGELLENAENLVLAEDNEDLAKEMHSKEDEDIHTYIYKDMVLVVKTSKEYAIYQLAAIDSSRMWLIVENEKDGEYIKYIKVDEYNRALYVE